MDLGFLVLHRFCRAGFLTFLLILVPSAHAQLSPADASALDALIDELTAEEPAPLVIEDKWKDQSHCWVIKPDMDGGFDLTPPAPKIPDPVLIAPLPRNPCNCWADALIADLEAFCGSIGPEMICCLYGTVTIPLGRDPFGGVLQSPFNTPSSSAPAAGLP